MQQLKLKVRYPKRYKAITDSNHSEAISPNRLDRQFNVAKPNQVWTTDITYIWTLQGWLYLAVVIDLFARRVVGWGGQLTIICALHCVSALHMAIYPKGTSGSESPTKAYCIIPTVAANMPARKYRQHLAVMGMQQSMSRKGNCLDNAPTERFFRSLKHEQLEYGTFRTKEAAKQSLLDYLAFYNGRRSHSPRDYQFPFNSSGII